VSFVVPTIYSWLVMQLLPKHEIEDHWKVWKEILLMLGVLLSIALGNLLYGKLIRIAEINWNGFINSAMVTVLLGLFPITLAILNKYHRLLRLNLETAKQANEQIAHPHSETSPPAKAESSNDKNSPSEEKVLRLIAENEKDLLEISEKQLLYIESQDNYSSVVYHEGDKIKKQLIRSSLKRMEAQVQVPHIKRCHRAFVVNLSKVAKVEGNAAGYALSFSESDTKVPVSRNYGPEVMGYFKAGA
jgi:hypothetical protein